MASDEEYDLAYDVLKRMVLQKTGCQHELLYGGRLPDDYREWLFVGTLAVCCRCPICKVKFYMDLGTREVIEAPSTDPKLRDHSWSKSLKSYPEVD